MHLNSHKALSHRKPFMGHAYCLKKQMYLNIEGTFLQKKCSLSLSLKLYVSMLAWAALPG